MNYISYHLHYLNLLCVCVYFKLKLLMFLYFLDNTTFFVCSQTSHTKEGEQVRVFFQNLPEACEGF